MNNDAVNQASISSKTELTMSENDQFTSVANAKISSRNRLAAELVLLLRETELPR
jgi:hypothetical protein